MNPLNSTQTRHTGSGRWSVTPGPGPPEPSGPLTPHHPPGFAHPVPGTHGPVENSMVGNTTSYGLPSPPGATYRASDGSVGTSSG